MLLKLEILDVLFIVLLQIMLEHLIMQPHKLCFIKSMVHQSTCGPSDVLLMNFTQGILLFIIKVDRLQLKTLFKVNII